MGNIKIGIKENILLFSIFVVMNFFVGAMVGVERTVLPIIGEEQFGLASTSAALSFIVSFGFSKAIINYFAGAIADRFGRKRALIAGWIVGLFVPILIIVAHAWWVIVVANILLGINQGLAWSMLVNMKIDVAKSTQRGTAVGLNEFAGYSGVAVFAAFSGYIAQNVSLRPEPFFLGIVIVLVGLILSIFVKDTEPFIKEQMKATSKNGQEKRKSAGEIFALSTWRDKNLSNFSFSGLTTNLKDGMAWGLFPLYFATVGLSVSEIGMIVAVYPAAWGMFQLLTGTLSDKWGRKRLIASGMYLQALSLWMILLVDGFALWFIAAALLGLGTAMVYPTLQAAISDVAAPSWRASSMGVYRFWRDTGYAFGALLAGLFADMFDVSWAIGLVALMPFIAGVLAQLTMDETLQKQ
ncbi:MFS transporter [Alkalibacillus almallahensis]|uniref:MFS transporter n=1 Tax=Alkalibacillus almallahensis TaxID=1379154 RepID=UPI001423463F|nr:MFS family permease [Alkalibacillus almallahensis]